MCLFEHFSVKNTFEHISVKTTEFEGNELHNKVKGVY